MKKAQEKGALIPLRGRDERARAFAIVDEADYEWLSQWRWQLAKGYARRKLTRDGKRTSISMHRQIMGVLVDHVNRDRLDNRRENLKPCTEVENQANRGRRRDSTSPYKGVTFDPRTKRWQARRARAGRRRSYGYHDTAEAAAAALEQA